MSIQLIEIYSARTTEGLLVKSEQPKKPSEEETPFSIYAKTGLSSEEAHAKI
ncbi:MAG: hypothetical protein ABSD42_09970 [Candidatus Bathyarchaeia archaeon]